MLLLGSSEIGGGYVRIGFMDGETYRKAGEHLTADEIKAIRNHRAWAEIGRLALYPPAPQTSSTPSNVVAVHPRAAERHVVSAGFGRFDVFEGRKLNDKALPKEEAEALAARKG